jgi:hypothetical protein
LKESSFVQEGKTLAAVTERALCVVLLCVLCCCPSCLCAQGALKLRQQALRSQEEEAQAAAASSYRRVEASGNTANADLPVR